MGKVAQHLTLANWGRGDPRRRHRTQGDRAVSGSSCSTGPHDPDYPDRMNHSCSQRPRLRFGRGGEGSSAGEDPSLGPGWGPTFRQAPLLVGQIRCPVHHEVGPWSMGHARPQPTLHLPSTMTSSAPSPLDRCRTPGCLGWWPSSYSFLTVYSSVCITKE
jgi:hypothetical protein